MGQEPETCLGTEYGLWRQKTSDLLSEAPPWRDPPERAIVTMGASDIAGLTPTVLRGFDGLGLRVDAVVGPGCPETQEQAIRDVSATVSADVRVTRDPDDFPERMFQADIAVSTASSTTYELLALGTPLVVVPIAENQTPIATALREHDAAAVLDREAGSGAFRQAIEIYQSNAMLRRDRRERGRGVVDGQGVERVGDAISEVVEQ